MLCRQKVPSTLGNFSKCFSTNLSSCFEVEHLRASPVVLQYGTLQKYISHPGLVMYSSFATPPMKTKTGTANRWQTTDSKPPGPGIMMGQSETLSSSHIIFITLFSAGCCTVNQPLQRAQLRGAETNFLS